MKKLTLLMMLLMIVFGVASVMAQEASTTTAVVAGGETKITLAGELRFRGEFSSNLTDQLDDEAKRLVTTPAPPGFKEGSDDHNAYYDGRVRLSVDAKIGTAVQGFLELESGTDKTDTWIWGNSAASDSGARGIYPNGNTKKGDIHIRQAWILYTKGMYGLKVGHQLWFLGNKLFFDHTRYGDDGIRIIIDPTKYIHIEVKALKFSEQATNRPDDGDAYVVEVKYKGEGGVNASADVAYVNDQGFAALVPTYQYAHVWNFGLRGDYTNGPVTVRGDIEAQAGKLENPDNSRIEDATVKGWAGLLGVDYKIAGNIPLKLTLEGAYGSGKSADDKNSDFKTFITSLGNDQHYTYVYEYKLKSAAGAISTGLANTLYIKGAAKAEFTKSLDAELALYWLQAAKKVALNAVSGPGLPVINPSKDLGWEVDTKITYKIAKNLQYFVEGGYMFTGKAYDNVVQTRVVPVAEFATERDDAYAIRNGIQFNF
ncbi:MAG: alginate export family protein [Nitrospirae bacterium]|uniref:alginate export family protein n=1 Tax=Candidatus Magnetobacterium casense TaxID=1455061 RepID=UPI0012DDEC68|nr:alginate export family protein [Candidatus Magnetobacterium casensis]MBF0337291.1 alginate export family protein [Nitrospirota bacterium]